MSRAELELDDYKKEQDKLWMTANVMPLCKGNNFASKRGSMNTGADSPTPSVPAGTTPGD